MKLQTVLTGVCLATIAGIIVIQHRTRSVVSVDDLVVYTGGSMDAEIDHDRQVRPRTSVFGGSGLPRSEIEEGARRYHELLAEARAAADHAPDPPKRKARPQWMPRGNARAQSGYSRPTAWKIGMNRAGSARIGAYRGSSFPGNRARVKRNAIQNRPSVFERSRYYRERSRVHSNDRSARQRRIYNRR